MLLQYKKVSIGWMIFEEVRSRMVLIAKNLQENILFVATVVFNRTRFPYNGRFFSEPSSIISRVLLWATATHESMVNDLEQGFPPSPTARVIIRNDTI